MLFHCHSAYYICKIQNKYFLIKSMKKLLSFHWLFILFGLNLTCLSHEMFPTYSLDYFFSIIFELFLLALTVFFSEIIQIILNDKWWWMKNAEWKFGKKNTKQWNKTIWVIFHPKENSTYFILLYIFQIMTKKCADICTCVNYEHRFALFLFYLFFSSSLKSFLSSNFY